MSGRDKALDRYMAMGSSGEAARPDDGLLIIIDIGASGMSSRPGFRVVGRCRMPELTPEQEAYLAGAFAEGRDYDANYMIGALRGASNSAGRTGHPIQGSVSPNDVVFGSVDQSGCLYRWSDGADGERRFMPVTPIILEP